MNTKIELLKYAANYCEDDTLIWIDFGIFKIFKTPKKCIAKLFQLIHLSFDQIVIPGCDDYLEKECHVDQVNWRFCGGFFVMPRKDVDRFYGHSMNVLRDFCTMPQYKLTWEVNLWVVIEACAEQKNIAWYQADHNDSMIFGIDQVMVDYIISP